MNLYYSIAEYRYAQMQRFNVRTVEEPIAEPITLEEACTHLNLTRWGSPPANEHDDWFEQIGIPGARAWCESYLGLSIAQQTLELATNEFPSTDYIDLPYGPVLAILQLSYIDTMGYEAIVDPLDYQLDTYSEPHRLYLSYGAEWPETELVRDVRNSVRVRYITGYTLAGDSPNDWPLPHRIKVAILLLLGHLFKNREESTVLKLENIPIGVRSFLDWDSERAVIV